MAEGDAGIVDMAGVAVLSTATLYAIQNRMVTGLAMEAIAGRIALSAIRPNPLKFIPYVGWAIAIGTVLYIGYEAYNATTLNVAKMEAGTYDEDDLAVFRLGFREARARFLATNVGLNVLRLRQKYILIPRQAMPMIARVDAVGMAEYGAVLRWDPAGSDRRRQLATGRLPPAGRVPDASGNLVPGSWEEYPFAVTESVLKTGSHVDKAPLHENWIQGGFIRVADMTQGFVVGETIYCYIL